MSRFVFSSVCVYACFCLYRCLYVCVCVCVCVCIYVCSQLHSIIFLESSEQFTSLSAGKRWHMIYFKYHKYFSLTHTCIHHSATFSLTKLKLVFATLKNKYFGPLCKILLSGWLSKLISKTPKLIWASEKFDRYLTKTAEYAFSCVIQN